MESKRISRAGKEEKFPFYVFILLDGKTFPAAKRFLWYRPRGEKRLLRQLSEGEMIYKIDFYDFRRLKLLSARFPSLDDGNLLLSGARLFIFRHLNRVRACR